MKRPIVSMEMLKAADIRPSAHNWRLHPPRQLRILKESIERLGLSSPLIARREGDEVVLIDGHARLEIASPEDTLETVILDIGEEDAKELMLVLDPISALATPNLDVLRALLAEVETSDVISDLLEELALKAGLHALPTMPDELPEQVEPRSKPGELYGLGRHRLLVGDATERSSHERLFEGIELARMIFTDPPWNVAIGQDSNPRHRQREGLANDDIPQEGFEQMIRRFIECSGTYLSGDLYVCMSSSQWPMLDGLLRLEGFHWSSTICWVKDTFVLGRSNFQRRFEPIWYGWKNRSSFSGGRGLDDVWEEPRPKASTEHPTMKPVALVARAISASSSPGDVVLDPFAGSGSTLIACEELHRRCLCIELDPSYADLVIARFERLTGERAKLLDAS